MLLRFCPGTSTGCAATGTIIGCAGTVPGTGAGDTTVVRDRLPGTERLCFYRRPLSTRYWLSRSLLRWTFSSVRCDIKRLSSYILYRACVLLRLISPLARTRTLVYPLRCCNACVAL
eukprot:2276489-Rhodomonas_salina.2